MNYTRLGLASFCGHLTKRNRKYCPKCREKHYTKVSYKLCEECGNEFRVTSSGFEKYKCCSYSCRNKQIAKRQEGEKSHLWRGGITSEDRKLRNSAEYASWRKSVMERDNYTCVMCGEKGGRLCADHIKEWCVYPALRFDINNGRTLCFECHKKTENFGYKAYSKMKDLEVSGTLQYRLI